MSKRIEDIELPFTGKLPQPLIEASFIKIKAKTEPKSQRFAINLMTPNDDISLHFNARISDGYIVCNSLIGQQWGEEERLKQMPFAADQDFTLIINAEKGVLRLFLNGVQLFDFKDRLPSANITRIAIDGDLKVFWIESQRMDFDHNHNDRRLSAASGQQQTNQTFFDPDLPFVNLMPNGLKIGNVLAIVGRPEADCKRFDISLVQSHSRDSERDVSYHVSVRFGGTDDEEEPVVVRNTKIGGQWGVEDRSGADFPFERQIIFDLRIVVLSNAFDLIINGINFAQFPNRLQPLSATDQIDIRADGGFRLLSVKF